MVYYEETACHFLSLSSWGFMHFYLCISGLLIQPLICIPKGATLGELRQGTRTFFDILVQVFF